MPNYQEGKIYTIRNYTDNSLIYVGSTTEKLARRLAKHRSDCNAGSCISLYSHIVDNDWSNWYIELYEYYPCNNRTELNRREGEVTREIGTLNKYIAGRTIEEYYEDNVDKIRERHKKYYEDNVDKLKDRKKLYREDKADKIKEYRKEYYEKNADKIKEKVCCDICGSLLSKQYLTRHQKTTKCTGAVR